MIGGGAIFAAGTREDLYGVELFMPPHSLIGFFENQVCQIDTQIETLHKGIILLTKVRDFLLPRLMNGEIVVWETVFAYNQESFGPEGTLGRASDREVVLVR